MQIEVTDWVVRCECCSCFVYVASTRLCTCSVGQQTFTSSAFPTVGRFNFSLSGSFIFPHSRIYHLHLRPDVRRRTDPRAALIFYARPARGFATSKVRSLVVYNKQRSRA